MAFNSLQYVVFLGVVFVVVWRLPHRAQNLFLLVASYGFYAAWDWRFLALLFVSTVIGYTTGIALDASADPARRRALLVSRVAVNLGILAVFKYANFFLDNAVGLLHAVGVQANEPALRIILPIAISYYTFEEISYTVDIYRRQITPCRDPVAYGLFVGFFPKLVAGPILRPKELIPQIERPRPRPGEPEILSALALLGWGLVKKVVIADSLALIVNQTYADPAHSSGISLLLGTLCFAGQIYGDFSGYTDMARGAARLLGFELPLNFRQPYLSSSLTAFWRTWHISLSSWLRDYLYIPLGGNQRGSRRTLVNLITVMVLGGLWHGAGWTFLIWGAIHGVVLGAERISRRAVDNATTMPTWGQLPRILVTFAVVCLAWVFFRAPDVGSAFTVVGRILTLAPGDTLWSASLWVGLAAVVIVASDLIERRAQVRPSVPAPGARAGSDASAPAHASGPTDGPVAALFRRHPAPLGALVGVCLVAVLITSGGAPVPFIYFQF